MLNFKNEANTDDNYKPQMPYTLIGQNPYPRNTPIKKSTKIKRDLSNFQCIICGSSTDNQNECRPNPLSHVGHVTKPCSSGYCFTQWLQTGTDINDNDFSYQILERGCYERLLAKDKTGISDCNDQMMGRSICKKLCSTDSCNDMKNNPDYHPLTQDLASIASNPVIIGLLIFVSITVALLCCYLACTRYCCYRSDLDNDLEDSLYDQYNDPHFQHAYRQNNMQNNAMTSNPGYGRSVHFQNSNENHNLMQNNPNPYSNNNANNNNNIYASSSDRGLLADQITTGNTNFSNNEQNKNDNNIDNNSKTISDVGLACHKALPNLKDSFNPTGGSSSPKLQNYPATIANSNINNNSPQNLNGILKK